MRLILGILLATTAAGPVLAADLGMPFKTPSYAPAFSWTGTYVGANVGGISGTFGVNPLLGRAVARLEHRDRLAPLRPSLRFSPWRCSASLAARKNPCQKPDFAPSRTKLSPPRSVSRGVNRKLPFDPKSKFH